MKAKYKVRYLDLFTKSYKKVVKGNRELEKRTEKAIRLLLIDPFYPSLKTHKVNTRLTGIKYSSRVTGDIRMIWDFDSEDRIRIILINIGGHSGKSKVYQ